nr:pentapeptide repeat-containing protein [Xanthomonadales bacterium]
MPFAYLTTFYSYKGGVGRTLAMANVGAVLAQRGEGRVLLVDCDLEAPGLHRIPSLTPPTPLDGGLLPWLAELDPDAPEDASRDALWLDALYAPRKDLALDVLPACHGDDAPRYYNRIDWPRWFAFKDRVTKTSALLQALRRMLVLLQSRGYAYVLIDSRTGFSDLGGLMLFQLPHMAVVVSNYNEQNLGGLKPVLKAMLRFTDPEQAPNHGEMRGYFPPPAGTPADAHQLGVLERWLVFSPVPGRLPELAPLREQRQERARALLGSDYAQNFYTEIPTYTAFQLQESLAVLDAPDGELAQSYRDIALKIEANRGERLRMLADAERATRRIGPVGLDSAQFGVATLRQGPSTTARGRSFEQKVAELLRLMGYEVQGETRVEGKKVDLIAKGGRGLRKEHYVVECKDQKAAISNSQVIELWSSVETEQQKVRHAGGIFVTSGDYSPDARAIGAAKGLLLYTLAELEREIFDPEPYAHAWQQAYEGKREAQSYVAQQVFITGGDQATRNRGAAPATTRPDQPLDVPDLAGPDSDVDTQGQTKAAERIDLIPYSLAWLGVGSSPQPLPNRFWLLLGNYGTGKSTFTRRLTFELLRRRRVGEAVPLPILINLKERAGAPNLDDLLQAFLREYRLDASLQQLRYGLEQGRAVLLLDSFDEMALAQYGRTLDQQLREFGRLVQEYPDARVLLTSRTHLFKSEGDLDRQVRSSDSLAQPGSALAGTARELGATVQTLAPFTPAQIGTFIRLHAPQRAEAIEHFIAQTHKLSELAPTAVLLEMIISGYDALRQRAATDEIRAAELYQVFVDEWLGARAHRHAELDTEQRKQWLEVLARLLWDTPGQRLHYQHLYEQIQSRRDLSAALDPARVDLELRTASFLTRNSAGDYGYSHRSFLEFFLARALLRALQATQGVAPEAAVLRLLPALPDTHMSPECLRFLRDLAELCCADARAVTAFWRHVATLLRQLLQAPRPPAQSANALRIARDCLPDPAEGIPEGAELAGADLSGETWALPLRGANLRGADLRRATFWAGEGDTWTFADLSGAVLAEAQIERADFSGVRLDSADVRGAHGEGARFVQSQCRGANFQLAQLMSAEFRGAELDGTDFSGTKLANARFRNASRSGWHWADAVFTGVPYTERPDHSLPCVTYPRTANVLTSRGSAAKMIQISDGLVMVGRSLGQIELWDVRSGHCTAVLAGHHGAITGLCTLPNGALASSSDGDGLKVWDHGHQSTGLSRPLRYGSIVSALCALPDGSLAAGSIDTTVHVCNLSDATSTILSGHDGRVSALCPLPEGNLASGSTDQTIRVWDFKHNKCTVLEGHNSPVTALCTLPNGILASGSADCTIRLWNIKNQSSIVLDGHFRGVTALCATST